MADEEHKPVYPERSTSSNDSLLEKVLGLIPGRLLLGLFLILCGTIPYFALAVYIVVFIAVVAFIMYTFHLAYAAKAASDEAGATCDTEIDGIENNFDGHEENYDANQFDSSYPPSDESWPPYDER